MIIESNKDLQPYNTFRAKARAEHFIEIKSPEDLQKVSKMRIVQKHKTIILGGGSNILITKNIKGVVIHNNIQGKKIIYEDDEIIIVTVWWGESWHNLVMEMSEKNRRWIENLALIPWTVWAAPVQNIGAYGVEIQDSLVSVEWINMLTGEKLTYTKEQCNFGYRDSIFKNKLSNKFFITHVTIQLSKKPNPQINYEKITELLHQNGKTKENVTAKDIRETVIAIRKTKLPDIATIGTAWSFFKNPIVDADSYKKLKTQFPQIIAHEHLDKTKDKKWKLSAWQLLDMCNCKGLRDGDIWTYQNHALVLVNYGKATGSEIREFAQKLQKIVKDNTEIQLEPEVNII